MCVFFLDDEDGLGLPIQFIGGSSGDRTTGGGCYPERGSPDGIWMAREACGGRVDFVGAVEDAAIAYVGLWPLETRISALLACAGCIF